MANTKGAKKKVTKKSETKTKKNAAVDKSEWLPIWMCLGISIGSGIGVATNNLALWMPLGIVFGLCFGLALANEGKK